MDIQTKITFIVKDAYRTEVIEKSIYILNDKIIKTDDIQFNEYKQVLVKIESDDREAYLEIDSSRDVEKRKIIKNKVKEEEINPGGSSESMLVPGIYGFKVYINSKVIELIYTITPSSKLEWKGLLNLRSYIESMDRGLSLDFHKQKMGLASVNSYEEFNIFDRYSKLTQDIEDILVNINNIIKNPLEDLKRQYKEKRYSSRSDSRSQRWLLTKGLYKNLGLTDQRFFYEKDMELTTCIIENIWFKKIVKSLKQEIIEIQDLFFQQINVIEKNETEKQRELDIKIEEHREILYKKNILQSDRSEIKYKVYNLKKDIENINKRKNKLTKYYDNLQKYKSKLEYILNKSWLKDVNDGRYIKKPTLKILKDYRYNYLFKVYKELNLNKSKDSGKISVEYSSKLTYILFEYYVLIHTMKIINNRGFQWPEELLSQGFSYISQMQESSKEIILRFKGVNNDIDIAYDNVIKNSSDGFTRGCANHTRPDIRIDLYEKNGEIKKSIIIEVKCREANCVYYEDNTVENQLKDYRYGFRYGKDEKDIVEKVIMVCLFTDKYKEIFEIKKKSIIGLPLEITSEEEIPRGYETLKNEIEKFLLED